MTSLSEYVGDKLDESSLSRIYQHLNSDRELGLITAFRGDYSEDENEGRNRKLASQVRNAGYGFIWVDGAWVENEGTEDEEHVSEVSLFIVGQDGQNQLRDLMVGWAREYNQDAFVYKPANQSDEVQLIDQQGNVLDTFRARKFDKVAGVYTRLRRGNHAGRNFVLESARERQGLASKLVQQSKERNSQ